MEMKSVFEPLINFLKNFQRKDDDALSKEKAKERLQLVLMQDRASVSPDFFEMMKKEIIEVIKKYIEIDEESLEVQLTRGFENGDETGPALYANIPIKTIKPVAKKVVVKEEKKEEQKADNIEKNETIDKKEDKEQNNIDNVAKEENIAKESKAVKEEKKIDTDKIVKEEKIVDAAKEVKDEKNIEVDKAKENKQEENIDKKENVEIKKEEAKKMEGTTYYTSSKEGTTYNTSIKDENNKVEAVQEINSESEDKYDFKAKLNNVKDGAKETFTKVKTQAQTGINKIKSKIKAKNN